jgi:secernin
MGANEQGVCVGNEAVFSKVPYELRENALTGLDIVRLVFSIRRIESNFDFFRLALERSKTAKFAVELIGELIEKYGQGGRCFDASSNITYGYDNSFLIVDREEAWSIETCDRVWVAKQIKGTMIIYLSKKRILILFILEGYYSMSNVYSIEDDYTLQSSNLEKFAKEKNFWNGKEKLNFAETFQGPSPTTDARLKAGRQLLENLTKNGNFSVFDMISILRDDQAGICVDDKVRGVRTTSSQVSVLTSHKDACHLLTGTPNPNRSLFKPFIFSSKVELGPLTVSSPSEVTFRRLHPLYSAHEKANWEKMDSKRLRDFEHQGIMEIINQLKSSEKTDEDTYETLFHDAVSAEIEFLREHPSTK